jgi:hypothetical protein
LRLTHYKADDANLYELSMIYAYLHDTKTLFHESKLLHSEVLNELKRLKMNVPESRKKTDLEILKSWRVKYGYAEGLGPHHQKFS